MMIKSKNRQIVPLSVIIVVVFLFIALFVPHICYSKDRKNLSPVMDCIESIIRNDGDILDLTLREVYRKCEAENAKRLAGDERRRYDKENSKRPFTLLAHNPTYFLILAHNFFGYDETIFHASGSDISLKTTETQFQISFKSFLWEVPSFDLPLVDFWEVPSFDIYVGYTNRAFWQMYNKPFSNPFREYNHEPEGWLQFYPEKSLFDFVFTEFRLGFSHQSNGKGDPLSRSWNRLFLNFTFERENLVVNFKPWLRVQEDSIDDNNPDITDYLGHGEIRLAYNIKDPGFATLPSFKDVTLSLMSRNNIESGFSKGAIELGASCSFGLTKNLKFYVQYFSGYGESLIDYNHYVNRLGIGIMLNDWL